VLGFFTFKLRLVVSATGEVIIEPVEIVEEECR
jgi:hypothetical protein